MSNNPELARSIDYINPLPPKPVDEDTRRLYSKVKDLVKNINIVFISPRAPDLHFKEADLSFIRVTTRSDVSCSDVIKVVNDCELAISQGKVRKPPSPEYEVSTDIMKILTQTKLEVGNGL